MPPCLFFFSPTIALDPPDGLLLDVTGCERLFHGEANLLNQCLDALAALGIAARGAIADTIGAAWALARAGPEPRLIVPPGQHAAALLHLPPWTLRLPRETVSRLDALGIDRIEALLMLPRASLPVRFGDELLRRLDQALGRMPEVMTPIRLREPVAARMSFETPLEQREPLAAALDRLVAEIVRQMIPRGLGARRIELMLFRPRGRPAVRSVTLTAPSRSIRHLTDLLRAQLDAVPMVAAVSDDPFLSAGIAAMTLSVPETARMTMTQGALFDPPETGGEATAELLDRLNTRLGPGGVVHARPVESYWPERAWGGRSDGATVGKSKAQGHECQNTGSDGATKRRSGDGLLPLRLLPRPQPILAMAVVPDGPLIQFRLGGVEHRVHSAEGPERRCAEWWTGETGGRDYYRVETEDGTWFWIYRQMESGQWFIHGVFE